MLQDSLSLEVKMTNLLTLPKPLSLLTDKELNELSMEFIINKDTILYNKAKYHQLINELVRRLYLIKEKG